MQKAFTYSYVNFYKSYPTACRNMIIFIELFTVDLLYAEQL